MEAWVGAAVAVLCIAVLWLARPRGGEVIPILKGERAQFAFAITWLLLFFVSVSFIVRQIAT